MKSNQNNLSRQQNICSVRCFFFYLQQSGINYATFNMIQIASTKNIQMFNDCVRQRDLKWKSMLNKIEGLKLALKWIIIFSQDIQEEMKKKGQNLSSFNIANEAKKSLSFLDMLCASIRPQAKEEEKNVLTINQAIERGRYLTEEQMAVGIDKLENFVDLTVLKNQEISIKNYLKYQTLFIFSFFLTLPTQRRQVIADFCIENIVKSDEMDSIILKFVGEKNMYFKRNLNRCFAVTGVAFRLLKAMLSMRAKLFPSLANVGPLILNAAGEKLTAKELTRRFTRFSAKFFGLNLNFLDLRHIRCTHFVRMVKADPNLTVEEKENAIENYALNIGNTKDMLLSHYVYLDNLDLVENSFQSNSQANAYYTDLLPIVKERSTPSVVISVSKMHIDLNEN